MGILKKSLSFLCVMFLAHSVFAKQLAFQVVQHDTSSTEVTEQSLVIEDQLVNSFFELGYIVTNSPAVNSTSDVQDEKFFKVGIGEAFEGYSDYFIQVKVYYADRKGSLTEVLDIEKIEWTITEATTGIQLASHSLADLKPLNKKMDTLQVTDSLIKDINNAIKALRTNRANKA